MYRLNFYVPVENLEKVKEALFLVGAGRIGNYEKCCWQVKGWGQFKPLENSKPTIGEHGQLEQLEEYRVEMICKKEDIKEIVNTLIDVHPYEEPAFDFVKILTNNDFN